MQMEKTQKIAYMDFLYKEFPRQLALVTNIKSLRQGSNILSAAEHVLRQDKKSLREGIVNNSFGLIKDQLLRVVTQMVQRKPQGMYWDKEEEVQAVENVCKNLLNKM